MKDDRERNDKSRNERKTDRVRGTDETSSGDAEGTQSQTDLSKVV
jgi:hypothetical protein